MLHELIKPTLVQKLIISYAIIIFCLVTALLYSITGLSSVSRTASEIGNVDLPAAEAVDALRDSLREQQRAIGRFSIISGQEYKQLYSSQDISFRNSLRILQQAKLSALPTLQHDYDNYDQTARMIFAGLSVPDARMKSALNLVEGGIETLQRQQSHHLDSKLAAAREKESKTIFRAIILAFSGVIITVLVAALLVYSLSRSIAKLKRATQRIAAGDFDHNPNIAQGDEVGDLANDFLVMASRLKELEQISLDASPLTRLPGNIAIERFINRQMKEKRSFAMCYLDLDNFKSYNDHYGYIKASELLKEAGQVIHESVTGLGKPDTFIGHIGGDDFVVIVDEEDADTACQVIIRGIDSLILKYYSEEDRKIGYIDGVDRYGVKRRFPLISISIAALICRPGDYGSAADIASTAAKVKDQVKGSAGSNYIIVDKEATYEA
ncbi:MAG: sensor domain-containing diguanylate cyclase [Desulfuromonadaceae bacterium]|nr:sensor domain-containing diguanylate cyclase [Desulfuromonadaceae bacterium]